MPNRQYANGANFERRVKARLEADGWTVFRTAGSHSPADLIAFPKVPGPMYFHGATEPLVDSQGVVFIQCKGGVTKMGPKARREFLAFADGLGAEAWIAERGMKLSRLYEREAVA